MKQTEIEGRLKEGGKENKNNQEGKKRMRRRIKERHLSPTER